MIDDLFNITQNDVDQLKKGDEAAWRHFVEIVNPLIASIVAWPKWSFSEQVKGDLIARIESDLPRSIDRFTGDSTVYQFVKKISIFKCIDEVRRQVKEREVFIKPRELQADGDNVTAVDYLQADDSFDPVKAVLVRELAQAVRELLEQAPEACKDLLNMYYKENLTYKEMSIKLGISINSVGPRLSGCYKKLRKKIQTNAFLRNYFLDSSDF